MLKMKTRISIFVQAIPVLIALFVAAGAEAQTGWNGYTCDACIPCGGPSPSQPCCSVYNACNGPLSPYNTYETGNGSDGQPAVGGCDMACTPIDSGILFLLLGGAAFGGLMIVRRREQLRLEPLK